MANDNQAPAPAPLLSPEQATALQENGSLSPDFASQFAGASDAFTTPELANVPPVIDAPIDPLAQEREMLQQRANIMAQPMTKSGFYTGIEGEGQMVTDSEALKSLAQKQEAEKEVIRQESLQADDVIDQKIAQRAEDQKNADALGIELAPDPGLEAIILQRQQEEEAALASMNPEQFVQQAPPIETPLEVANQGADMVSNVDMFDPAAGQEIVNRTNAKIDSIYQGVQDAQEVEMVRREERIAKLQEKQNEMAETLENTELEYMEAMDSAEAAGNKTIYSDKSTGQSIMAGMAIFLSGFGEGLQGRGGNPVLQQMYKKLEQDTKNAQFKTEKLGSKLNKEQSLYDKFYERLKDPEQAYNATMAAKYKDMQVRMNMVGQKFSNEQSQLKREDALRQLQAKEMEHRNAIMKDLQAKEVITNAHKYTPAEITNVLGVTDGGKINERIVPGWGLAKGSEVAKVAAGYAETSANVDAVADDLINNFNSYKDKFNFMKGAQAVSSQKTLMGKLRLAIVGPGAVSEREMELLMDLIPDTTKFWSLPAVNKASLERLKTTMKQFRDVNLGLAGIDVEKIKKLRAQEKNKVTSFRQEQP